MIVFNKPYLTGKEIVYIEAALKKQTSGSGEFTERCQSFLENRYTFRKVLLTTSCTDALEMAAILLNVSPGDEVIIPSFTFVSTANAFVLRGARIVFADSQPDNPNLDVSVLEPLITSKTKAIVVVHYAGVAVDMNPLMGLAKKYNISVVEDAAQALDAYYCKQPLGSIGHLACFSFHETKNIISGEGGMLVINDERFIDRAEILWEKGTNRKAFKQGKVDKYSWVDVGSSYLPSEVTAAFLYAQLEVIEDIQHMRLSAWNYYQKILTPLLKDYNVTMTDVPDFSVHNGHIFYIVAERLEQRNFLIQSLMAHGIDAHFHYPSLHRSDFHRQLNPSAPELPNSVKFSERLIRLPLYTTLSREDQTQIAAALEQILSEYKQVSRQI